MQRPKPRNDEEAGSSTGNSPVDVVQKQLALIDGYRKDIHEAFLHAFEIDQDSVACECYKQVYKDETIKKIEELIDIEDIRRFFQAMKEVVKIEKISEKFSQNEKEVILALMDIYESLAVQKALVRKVDFSELCQKTPRITNSDPVQLYKLLNDAKEIIGKYTGQKKAVTFNSKFNEISIALAALEQRHAMISLENFNQSLNKQKRNIIEEYKARCDKIINRVNALELAIEKYEAMNVDEQNREFGDVHEKCEKEKSLPDEIQALSEEIGGSITMEMFADPTAHLEREIKNGTQLGNISAVQTAEFKAAIEELEKAKGYLRQVSETNTEVISSHKQIRNKTERSTAAAIDIINGHTNSIQGCVGVTSTVQLACEPIIAAKAAPLSKMAVRATQPSSRNETGLTRLANLFRNTMEEKKPDTVETADVAWANAKKIVDTVLKKRRETANQFNEQIDAIVIGEQKRIQSKLIAMEQDDENVRKDLASAEQRLGDVERTFRKREEAITENVKGEMLKQLEASRELLNGDSAREMQHSLSLLQEQLPTHELLLQVNPPKMPREHYMFNILSPSNNHPTSMKGRFLGALFGFLSGATTGALIGISGGPLGVMIGFCIGGAIGLLTGAVFGHLYDVCCVSRRDDAGKEKEIEMKHFDESTTVVMRNLPAPAPTEGREKEVENNKQGVDESMRSTDRVSVFNPQSVLKRQSSAPGGFSSSLTQRRPSITGGSSLQQPSATGGSSRQYSKHQ